jgi:hypothetical protein
MKKFPGILSVLLLAIVSCNSGTGSESSASDSTAIQKDTSTMQADTSRMAMNTPALDALPAIPADAKVFFKNLKNGETVSSPVKVEMGATGISIDSAGTVKPNSGHFHLLIDAGDSTAAGVVVPKDSTHLHFGNAQKEATIKLTPGKHTLTLQLADGIHRSYGSKLSEAITLNVKK